MDAIVERMERIEALVEGVAQDISSISKILIVGNGQPALTVKVAILEQQLRDMSEDKNSRDGRRWQLLLVFGTCIVSLLTAIIPHLFPH